MRYEEPPPCKTCTHRGEMHEDWWKPKTKSCSQWSDGRKCDCRAYVRSTT